MVKIKAKVIHSLKTTQAAFTLQPGQDLVVESLYKEVDDPDNAQPVEIEYINARGEKSGYTIHPNPANPLKRLEIRGARITGPITFRKYEPPIVDMGEMPIEKS